MAGPSISDVVNTIQQGVQAINNFGAQIKGSFTNISAKIVANTAGIAANTAAIAALASSGSVTSIAGNTGAFTLNAVSGITNSTNDIVLSQASTSQFGAVKADGTTITVSSGVITAVSAPFPVSPITNSLAADVNLASTSVYSTGPSIAQGTTGTWWVSGQVTVVDPVASAFINAKLWDGTSIIDSATGEIATLTATEVISLSGYIVSPSSNLKISVLNTTRPNGKILFNQSGNSKDSTISAFRIA